MKIATTPQIQKIHVLLNQLGIMNRKKEIVYQLTEGRTTSTKELLMDEATQLITSLAQFDPADKLKRAIFSLAYKAGIIYGERDLDKKLNAIKLNGFLKERGAVKKSLNEMTYSELIKVHRQFEALNKNVQKASLSKEAELAVTSLLQELNFKYPISQ
jgi:phosphoglycerate dehydrogenase-like enzyme